MSKKSGNKISDYCEKCRQPYLHKTITALSTQIANCETCSNVYFNKCTDPTYNNDTDKKNRYCNEHRYMVNRIKEITQKKDIKLRQQLAKLQVPTRKLKK